jgi:aminoglycoside phosphotransferase family enzyme/predicted kinase
MNTPEFISALMDPGAYGHPCGEVQLVETHISWVFLTGEYAYKVKKQVHFNFVDFSTLERRAHYCEEEVRCNRSFSPELYVGVVTINQDDEGRYHVAGPGRVVEWAVKMRQFPGAQQLDNLLAAGTLEAPTMRRFGLDLADQHAQLPRLKGDDDEVDTRVRKPVLDNFRTLGPLRASRRHESLLNRLEADSRSAFQRLRPQFVRRLRDGFTRECHGDLHLSNLVVLGERVRAFDCLEFNANLRWIDTASDVAFLLMDCAVRGHQDLGYAFLDGYLTRSADYEGTVLAAFFQVYRSLVRAKVAALQLEELTESPDESTDQQLIERLALHLRWADERLHRKPGMLLLMCGLSGSGKSYLAERLVPQLPAVRVRSDVLRKARAGIDSQARSNSPVDGGLYSQHQTQSVYAEMLRVTEALIGAGENVLVDATFLDRGWRSKFRAAARRLGSGCVIVHCEAPQLVLEDRIRDRAREPENVSEAGLEVLQSQLKRFDAITPEEPSVVVDTQAPLEMAQLENRIREALI